MEKFKNTQELIDKLSSKNNFEQRYDYLIEDCKFSQAEIININLESIEKTPQHILDNLIRISQMELSERKSERIQNMKKGYSNNIEDLLDDSLIDAKKDLSNFLSDPDGNGMGIYGYDKRIHTIYENHMEKFLEKAKEITAPKKDNITHLEEDNIITIFNKKDNGLEKIATINLDKTDNMIVNIQDVKMKNKIMDYVEEIQENKIVKVNISKGVNNEFDDFHQRVKKLYSQQNENEAKNNLSL